MTIVFLEDGGLKFWRTSDIRIVFIRQKTFVTPFNMDFRYQNIFIRPKTLELPSTWIFHQSGIYVKEARSLLLSRSSIGPLDWESICSNQKG
jgi:hypothetical protein